MKHEHRDSLLLSFWALSIVRISTNQKTQRFGNWICFRNVVFFWFVEIRMMDEVQKLSSNECYTPTSEPFRMYMNTEATQYFFGFQKHHYICTF
jgi:hypothetical protein